ncbi:hypothetical protein [Pleomorphomonas carboxyditropha]|uniref:Uncharacterized protein n=1 Tax=Pleomorphomonas carboxyditropha TaxID=2023338 RepID=A0A2G9WWX3_9HYPH|nr:hypothetical protein [Pleomorphomonas carboxyditropha]PIO99183.1 hypothetical protein CJ014_11985 [Pleomorphomonas carboxyditropha]
MSDSEKTTAPDAAPLDAVARLRAAVYADGGIDSGEVRRLCRLAAEEGFPTAAGRQLYIEALTDYVALQTAPSGHVSEEMARWLIGVLSADGITTDLEVDLLVNIMRRADSVPAELSAFALAEVSRSVLAGTDDGEGGVISAADVERLRSILYAFGNERSVGISREEAEVLFDLNDRSREAENDPAWSDLFVKAIASFLMAARGYTLLSREETLGRDAWLDAPSGGVTALFGDMLSSMLSNGLRGVWSAWRQPDDASSKPIEADESRIREAEAVTSEEVKWLADRIGRDGVIHANERALLKFLSEESPDIHPSLRTLLDTAA